MLQQAHLCLSAPKQLNLLHTSRKLKLATNGKHQGCVFSVHSPETRLVSFLFRPLLSGALRLWSKVHFTSSSSQQSTSLNIRKWRSGLRITAAVRLINRSEDKSTFQSLKYCVFNPSEKSTTDSKTTYAFAAIFLIYVQQSGVLLSEVIPVTFWTWLCNTSLTFRNSR